jgi:hypothetical protein
MKYMEKKSSRIEYKQKEIQGKTDRVYADPVQRRALWKLVVVGARKKPSNGRKAVKPVQRRSAETAKKKKKKKKKTQKT